MYEEFCERSGGNFTVIASNKNWKILILFKGRGVD